MKDCDAIALELPGYVNGKIEPEIAGPVRVHLQSCNACQAEVGQLRRLESLLTNHLPVIEPSPGFASVFANRLAAEVAAEDDRKAAREERGSLFGWLLRPWLIPVAAAATLGALLIAPWLSQGPATISPVVKVPSIGGGVAAKKLEAKPETKLAAVAAPEKGAEKGVAAVADKGAGTSVATASPPPADLIDRQQLFVDFAVIRDLDMLEADGTG